MKVTQMAPVHAANLVANSGNTAYAACVTLWRQLQTRFWDASPRTSVQKQQLMVFSFFSSCSHQLLLIFPPWLHEWINYLQFTLRRFKFWLLKFEITASFLSRWAIIRWYQCVVRCLRSILWALQMMLRVMGIRCYTCKPTFNYHMLCFCLCGLIDA